MNPTSYSSSWTSPSNIALVKYWGKHAIQLPNNPSISITLEQSVTRMKVTTTDKKGHDSFDVTVYFDNETSPSFTPKITQFFDKIVGDYPFLSDYGFVIHSSNTFPHSAGIASSASSMSALSLCIIDIANDLGYDIINPIKEASRLSRIASGSASRSLFGGMASWGENSAIQDSSNLWATPFKDFHPVFDEMNDSILIVSSEKKNVSSSVGHQLMVGNPYAEARYNQANENMSEIVAHMRSGNLDAWGTIVEDEALTLHALMMTSKPSFILLKPNTLAIIEVIRAYRKDTGIPVYFTIDAGPNIHLLYPKNVTASVHQFINESLKQYCENGLVIYDKMGTGPKKVSID